MNFKIVAYGRAGGSNRLVNTLFQPRLGGSGEIFVAEIPVTNMPDDSEM